MDSVTIDASLPCPIAGLCNEIITISFLEPILPLIESRFVQKPEQLVEPQSGRRRRNAAFPNHRINADSPRPTQVSAPPTGSGRPPLHSTFRATSPYRNTEFDQSRPISPNQTRSRPGRAANRALPAANSQKWRELTLGLLTLRFRPSLSIIRAMNGIQTDYGISLFVPILWSKAEGG
jgi:hypothetical protein